jgi:hypothetical protein
VSSVTIVAQPRPAITPQSIKRSLATVLMLAGFFFGIPLALLTGALTYHDYKVSRTWTAVQAEVVRVNLYSELSRPGRSSSLMHGIRWTVRYPVHGQIMEGDVDLGYASSSTRVRARWEKKLPVGSHLTVLYDPDAPWKLHLGGKLVYARETGVAPWAAGALLLAAAGVVLRRRGSTVDEQQDVARRAATP